MCYLRGIRVLPDLIVALIAIYLTTLLFYYLQNPAFPFSVEKAASLGGAAMIRVFLTMAFVGACGFLHKFLLNGHNHLSIILIPLYLGITSYINRFFVYRRITWKLVDKVNSY